MKHKPGGNPGPFSLLQFKFDNQTAIAHCLLVAAIAATPAGGFPVVGSTDQAMRSKTVPAATLAAFAAALAAKRETAAAAAAAAKTAKDLAESLGLPSESVLIKSDDRSTEVAAIWTERPMREVAARVDTFHAYKVTKVAA